MPAERKAPARRSHVSDVRPEYLALGFLMETSLHGYDLYRRFEAELGQVWHLSQSQVYAILKRLEAQAYVEANLEPGRKSQEKRRLAITEAGQKRFEEWLSAPTDCSSRIIRLEFISRLYFAKLLRPSLLPTILKDQREALARHLANHERLLRDLPPGETWNRLSMELRVRQISAILAWVEEGLPPAFA
jgi:PadR family transcriptional regulator, regulatory protein AphA